MEAKSLELPVCALNFGELHIFKERSGLSKEQQVSELMVSASEKDTSVMQLSLISKAIHWMCRAFSLLTFMRYAKLKS